jgi:hypothetical protein
MATPATDDMDVLEIQDQEDEVIDAAAAPVVEEEEVTEDLAQEEDIVKEIDKVAVETPEEDAPAKAKPHMISDELIHRPLSADDWMDDKLL